MTEIRIAGDLQTEHRIFSNGKNVQPTAEDYVRLIERTSQAELQLERMTDLVRYMRHELLNEKLIDVEEWTALTVDSEDGQRVARLEGYDKMRKLCAVLLTALRTHAENLESGLIHRAERVLNEVTNGQGGQGV